MKGFPKAPHLTFSLFLSCLQDVALSVKVKKVKGANIGIQQKVKIVQTKAQ